MQVFFIIIITIAIIIISISIIISRIVIIIVIVMIMEPMSFMIIIDISSPQDADRSAMLWRLARSKEGRV